MCERVCVVVAREFCSSRIREQASMHGQQTNERTKPPAQAESVGRTERTDQCECDYIMATIITIMPFSQVTNKQMSVCDPEPTGAPRQLTHQPSHPRAHTLNSHSSSSHKLIKSLRPSAWAAHCPVVPMDPRVVAGLGMYAF